MHYVGNFNRVLARAHAHNMRVIAMNRRDYIGSSLFSQPELDVIKSRDPDVLRPSLKERGLELLRFLVWVIDNKGIPRAKEGGGGGLALLGWSLGNVTTLAFLAFLGDFERSLVERSRPWLTTFFIYGAFVAVVLSTVLVKVLVEVGSASLGYPVPEGGYHPLRDTSIPEPVRMLMFGTWVSSYYSHPYFTTFSTETHKRVVTALQTRTPPKGTETRSCTLDTLSAKELRASIDSAPNARSEQGFIDLSLDVLSEMRHRAIVLEETEDTSQVKGALPALRVRLVYGTASVWSAPWAAWCFENDIAQMRTKGTPLRDVATVCAEGANHFVSLCVS